jgi:Sulfotransferase family
VAVGHVPYSRFQAAELPAGTRFMTFLRDPVDRVLSHYYGHVHPAHSIEEAVEEMRLPLLRNLATRFLCGDPDPWGELSPLALYGARVNLRRFAFVGIQERFEESMERLQAMLGLDIPRKSYEDRHVNADRPAAGDISSEQRALILRHNSLDAELYTFALRLFDRPEGDLPGAPPQAR